jgi:hypothetical protein
VLFAPHWTSFTGPASFQKSAIEELSSGLIAIQGMTSRVNVTLRPHPRLIENLATFFPEGISGLGWDWMQKSIHANPINDFEASGILVTNSLSFIAEFTFTGKPLVFWSRGSEIIGQLSEFGRQCLSVNYVCESREELLLVIRSLFDGHDPKKSSRERFVKEVRQEFSGATFEENLVSLIKK